MAKIKLSLETQRALHQESFYISSLYQPESLFRDNGRKLKRVAEAGDPWIAQLFYPMDREHPSPIWPLFIQWGQGDTAEEAVLDALRKATGIEGRYRKLECAIGLLMESLRGCH
jgi:hypothetical protein